MPQFSIFNAPLFFPVVFCVNRLCFPEFDGVQVAGATCECGFQPLPDQQNKVLRSWLQALRDEIHIQIQVAVVEVFGDFSTDDVAEFFHVHDESGDRIGPTFYGDVQGIVVAVPVLVGAFAEYFAVLLFGPSVHPKFVGGVEAFDSGDVKHAGDGWTGDWWTGKW